MELHAVKELKENLTLLFHINEALAPGICMSALHDVFDWFDDLQKQWPEFVAENALVLLTRIKKQQTCLRILHEDQPFNTPECYPQTGDSAVITELKEIRLEQVALFENWWENNESCLALVETLFGTLDQLLIKYPDFFEEMSEELWARYRKIEVTINLVAAFGENALSS